MTAKQITVPTKYKTCTIAPTPGAPGFDVFDGKGRWFNVQTQKQAKWWASVHARLESEFSRRGYALRHPPKPVEDHTPKSKEQ